MFFAAGYISNPSMKSGPIIIVDDDADDQSIFEDVLSELRVANPRIMFENCLDAMDYLRSTSDQPFLIFCDVNLPKLNGIEFKRQIDGDPELRKKSIPFIFYSTSVDQFAVNEAYTQMTVQGFFQKQFTYDEVLSEVKIILDYWSACRHPNIE